MAVSGWVVFLIVLFIALVATGGGYIFYTQYRARRLGLPPPSLNPFARNADAPSYRGPAPAPGGIQGWVADKWAALRNTRSAGGAYESTSYGGGNSGAGGNSGRDRRGFGPLDPDEAWDARVDHEAGGLYYEEQELGLQDPQQGPYGGGGYGGEAGRGVGVGGIEVARGRSRSRQRELDTRYDEEVHGGSGGGRLANPFGDAAEPSSISLRSISPRPDADHRPLGSGGHKRGQSSLEVGSAEHDGGYGDSRRSMFREDM